MPNNYEEMQAPAGANGGSRKVRRPGLLPRTLRGAGGIRLIDLPGVKYPEAVLHGRKGADPVSGRPYAEPPPWGISTREAAVMLGVSVRSARALLNRYNARYRLVARPGSCACLYWDRSAVEELRRRRLPLVLKVSGKLCTAREACCILFIARSSLTRYVQSGLLKEYRVRHVTRAGARTCSFFHRGEVHKLAARRNAARARNECARRDRLQREWNAQKQAADMSPAGWRGFRYMPEPPERSV